MSLLKEKASTLIDKERFNIDEQLAKYESFILAYCSELKITEYDILANKKIFDSTFHLFENIVLRRQLVD